MKLTRNTTDHLIIEHKPAATAIFFAMIGVALIGWGGLTTDWGANQNQKLWVGGLALIFFVIFSNRRVQLVLNRPDNKVELRTRSFFKYERMYWELKNLERATTLSKEGRHGRRSRIVLIFNGGMDAGSYQVNHISFDEKIILPLEHSINIWLAKSRMDYRVPG